MPFHRCGISASISAVAERRAVGRAPLVEHEVGRWFVVGEHDRERAEFLVEALEQGVDLVLELLGDHDLVAVPGVWQLGGRQRLRQLRSLIEVPRREVVVHLDDARIVRIEVERFT